MSEWRFRLRLEIGLALLAANLVEISWLADGPKLQIDAGAIDDCDVSEGSVFDAILRAARLQSFAVSGNGGEVIPLAKPWAVCVEPEAMPSGQDLLAAELALELWLVPIRDTNDFDACRKALEERRPNLREDVREALAYWLLVSTHPLGGRPDLKMSWRSDTSDVLVMRSPDWTSRRRPREPLLATAQRLLEEMTKLRGVAATLASYDQLIDTLGATSTPLPDAFRQAVWWEAGYQLSARGLHREAGIATERYRIACDCLTARLPGLVDAGIPGFGLGVGERAYYAGEFRVALEAYRKEWNSGSDRHRSRLKRSIANVFSDLGALAAARRLAEEALSEQEIAGDPETYKTLGRCGEIALRSGDVASAAEFYRRSHEAQKQLLGEQGMTGQTAVYRGHVALLAGHLDEAASWYDEARQADALKDSRLNAYALMGEAALALRREDHSAVLACLDRLDQSEISSINGDALPCAVIALAGVVAGAPREKGMAAIRDLLKNNYMADAFVLLPLAYPRVSLATKALNRIADALRQWDKALLELPELVGDRADADPTPRVLLEAIAEVRKRESWAPLDSLQAFVFPSNLVTVSRTLA